MDLLPFICVACHPPHNFEGSYTLLVWQLPYQYYNFAGCVFITQTIVKHGICG